jgi:hypothetical protein
MLTIKHYESEASESVLEARSTEFTHSEGEPPKLLAFGASIDGSVGINVDGPNGGGNDPNQHTTTVAFGNGVVFVMNGSGSTIAKYDLDAIAEQWHDREKRGAYNRSTGEAKLEAEVQTEAEIKATREYSGMTFEQASREAEHLIKRDGWFKSFGRLGVLRSRMLETASTPKTP